MLQLWLIRIGGATVIVALLCLASYIKGVEHESMKHTVVAYKTEHKDRKHQDDVRSKVMHMSDGQLDTAYSYWMHKH